MKRFLGLLLVSILLPLGADAALIVPDGFTFEKNLKSGTTAPDVMYLQNVLNASEETAVAETGAGSDSSLTSSFGPMTKDAVMRFQSLYGEEILKPANLIFPNGVVGQLTRAKLNAVLQTLRQTPGAVNTVNAVSTPSYSSSSGTYNPFEAISAIPDSSQQVNVFGISTYSAVPGQAMGVFGKNFDPKFNTVQVGGEFIKNIPSQSGGTLIPFNIPATIPTGAYSIVVYNKYGIGSSGALALTMNAATTSKNLATNATIFGSTSTKNVQVTPSLSGMAPKSSKLLTQVIVLSGDGFTADNTILTNLGNLYHIPSGDGKTLSFTVGTLPLYASTLEKYKGQSGYLKIKVSNTNGISKEEYSHVLSFPASGVAADATPSTAGDLANSTADFQKYVASTSYSYYVPFTAASSTDSIIQGLFGTIGSMNLGTYSTQKIEPVAGVAPANKPAESTLAKPVANPYITAAPVPAAINTITATNTIPLTYLSPNPSPSFINGSFGGVVTKILQCTADNTAIMYVRDYTHLFKVYGIIYDPQTSKIGSPLGTKDTVGVNAIVSGSFVPKSKDCLSGKPGSTQPQSVVDTALGTITVLEKMI